jgi:predicted glycosyltransferase involved in capsule biosynthesis
MSGKIMSFVAETCYDLYQCNLFSWFHSSSFVCYLRSRHRNEMWRRIRSFVQLLPHIITITQNSSFTLKFYISVLNQTWSHFTLFSIIYGVLDPIKQRSMIQCCWQQICSFVRSKVSYQLFATIISPLNIL